MEDVLESITSSLIEIKKIKEQRRAGVHAQILQSYIIFFIFIGVMIVIQNMLVPYLIGEEGGLFNSLNSGSSLSIVTGTTTTRTMSILPNIEIKFDSLADFVVTLTIWFTTIRGIFMMLTLIQGFFAGVIIGKLAEGDITAGLKHSIVLMTIAIFIMSMFKPNF